MKRIIGFDGVRTCAPVVTKSTELVVVDGLAITPSQVAQLSARGIPVSMPPLASSAYDSSKSFDVDPVYRRGEDMNTLWNLQRESRRKIVDAHNNDVKKYG